MLDLLSRPWPWYVAGPLIGLTVPLLLVLGNKQFGVSSGLRHLCAAVCPGDVDFFRYDWKSSGLWNIALAAGILLGATFAVVLLAGNAPPQVFTWAQLFTFPSFVCIVIGGFLVGFGTAYAGGCTSGHAIAGLADFQLPSLVAVLAFFAGGLVTTFVFLPWLFR